MPALAFTIMVLMPPRDLGMTTLCPTFNWRSSGTNSPRCRLRGRGTLSSMTQCCTPFCLFLDADRVFCEVVEVHLLLLLLGATGRIIQNGRIAVNTRNGRFADI
jgi:hypothetical protein